MVGLGGMLLVLALVFGAFLGGLQLGRAGASGVAGSGSPGTTAGDASTTASAPESAREKLPLLYEAWKIVEDNYVDRSALDPTSLTYGAIRGLLESLDDRGHSGFLTPEEVAAQESGLSGEYVGIGVELTIRKDGPAIVGVFEGSPAEKAGLRPGDRILAVDGMDVTGESFDGVREKVRGPEGTTVTVTIIHPGETTSRDVVVTRQKITVPISSWAMVPGTTTALIRFQQFSSGAADQLKADITAAREAGATSIALDLRGNSGGYVDEAVAVASQFLPSGVVYRERDAEGREKTTEVRPGGLAVDVPLVILVDEGTASSAEIVSGAMQDAGRAKLVGTKTFGTGTVVATYRLADGSAVRVGVLEWLTPKGRQIWREGIAPDVEVVLPADATALTPSTIAGMTAEQVKASSDAQLIEALRILGQG
jgi:carboxyl-terminal processing protease